MATKRQLAAIAIARKQLGMSDDAYRALLYDLAGVRTAKDLGNPGVSALFSHFVRLGWRPALRRPFYGHRRGMASQQQVSLVRGLWAQYAGEASPERDLDKWIHRTFGVSSLRFLTAECAPKAIAALRAMAKRRQGAESGEARRAGQPAAHA